MRSSSLPVGTRGLAAVSQGFVVNVAVTLANVASGILVARGVGAHGRGELAALTTLPGFLSVVLTLGVPSALVYHARRRPESLPGLVAGSLALLATVGTAGVVAGILAAPRVLGELDATLLPTAQLLVLFTLLGLVTNVGMATLQAGAEFRAYHVVRVAQPLVQLAALAALAATGRLDPVTGALAVLLSGAPGMAWMLHRMAVQVRPHWSAARRSLGDLVDYGRRAAGGELLVSLATQLDKVILVGLLQPAAMGLYVVALSLSRLVAIFSASVVPVLFPVAADRDADGVIRITCRAATVTGLLALAAGVVLIAAGGPLLAGVYGAEFGAAAAALGILVVEATVSSVVQVLSQAFLALDRPGLVSLQYGLGTVVAVVLLFVLVPPFGLEGAAFALLAAGLSRLACTWWCFAVVLKTGPWPVRAEAIAAAEQLRALALRWARR